MWCQIPQIPQVYITVMHTVVTLTFVGISAAKGVQQTPSLGCMRQALSKPCLHSSLLEVYNRVPNETVYIHPLHVDIPVTNWKVLVLHPNAV